MSKQKKIDRIQPQGNERPFVSVLISAKNERANLTKYLKSILDQDYHDFEVIVVSDHSTDGTDSLLLDWAQQNETLQVILNHGDNHGKKASLQLAVSKAKGSWLLFTDADCSPHSKKWIGSMVSYIDSDSEIVVGVGPTMVDDSVLSRWVAYENVYVMVQYTSMAKLGYPYMAVGRNLMYKRSLFERVGGYISHQHLPSGDDDLFIRDAATTSNTRIAFNPATFVYSAAPSSVSGYINQKVRHFSTSFHYKKSIQFILMLNHISHLSLILSLILIPFYFDLIFCVFTLILVRYFLTIHIYCKLYTTIYPVRSTFHFIIFDTIIPIVYLFFVFYIKKNKSINWK